jgi:hypothetical protein
VPQLRDAELNRADEEQDDDADADADDEEQGAEDADNGQQGPAGSKVNLSHFSFDDAHVLRRAFPAYRSLLSTRTAFPSVKEEIWMAAEALEMARELTEMSCKKTALTQKIVGVALLRDDGTDRGHQIIQRSAQLRGDVKTAASMYLPGALGLDSGKRFEQANRDIVVVQLKDHGFMYKVSERATLAAGCAMTSWYRTRLPCPGFLPTGFSRT